MIIPVLLKEEMKFCLKKQENKKTVKDLKNENHSLNKRIKELENWKNNIKQIIIEIIEEKEEIKKLKEKFTSKIMNIKQEIELINYIKK